MKAYKIFDVGWRGDDPVPKTLFHGIPGRGTSRTRVLPVGRWLWAEAKLVKDGSGKSQYISGFHCYTSMDAVKDWFKTGSAFNRIVVQVEIGPNYRSKNRAVRHTLLADKIRISEDDWANRILAVDLMGEK